MSTKLLLSALLLVAALALPALAPWQATRRSSGPAHVHAMATETRAPAPGASSLLPFSPAPAGDYRISLDGVTADAYAFEPEAGHDAGRDRSMADGIVGRPRGR